MGGLNDAMLASEDLFSLDALVWLQSGQRAGALVGAHQSTMSRRSRECLQRLGMTLEQCDGSDPQGPLQELLLMERELHQQYRLRGGAPLRLHANYWARSALLQSLPADWIAPEPELVKPHSDPIRLLAAGIVDAALLSGPEVHDLDRQRWSVITVATLPLQVLVPQAHPLAAEWGLEAADLADLDPLAFSAVVPGAVQRAMAHLYRHLGAGRLARRPSAAVIAPPCMATAFTRHLWPGYRALDLRLPLLASDHLVVRRDLAWGARLEPLLAQLRQQLQSLEPQVSGLRCLLP